MPLQGLRTAQSGLPDDSRPSRLCRYWRGFVCAGYFVLSSPLGVNMRLSMKAVLPAARVENVRMPQTAQVGQMVLVAYRNRELREVITARFYFSGRDGMSPVRCALWVRNSSGDWYSGSGSASGCGYHKWSAALQGAIDAAGIELYGNPYQRHDKKPNFRQRARIDGVGDSAMKEAMHAIAIACGYRGARLIVD